MEEKELNRIRHLISTAILFLFFLITTLGFAIAQNPNEDEMTKYYPKKLISSVELMAGPAISFLRGAPYVDNNEITTRSLKLGYTFGISIVNPLKQNFDLAVTLVAEKKGSISTFNSTYFDPVSQSMKSGTVENDYIYNCISMPIILGYSIGKRKKLNFGVGIFTSYITKQTMTIFRNPQGPGGVEDQTDLNTKFDFGAALKLGYGIPISDKAIFNIQILDTWGLINTRADPNYGVIKTNNTSLLFGVTFKR
jgi:hypothetical protein